MTYDKVKGSGGKASVAAARTTQTQRSLEEWLTEIETWNAAGLCLGGWEMGFGMTLVRRAWIWVGIIS